jgi:hypothetical protein
MSVSVAAFQLRILVVAIVLVAFGRLVVVSIGDGRAANDSFITESQAGDAAPPPAGSRPAVAPTLSIVEDQDLSKRRDVNAIRGRVPVSAPIVLAGDAFATGGLFAERRGPDDILATLADIYDDTRTSPMWPDSLPSPASLTPAGLARLLGICGGVALCIYGLLAFKLRRRSDRRPPGRGRAHAPPPFA